MFVKAKPPPYHHQFTNRPYFRKYQKTWGVEHLFVDIRIKGRNTTITHYNIVCLFKSGVKAKPLIYIKKYEKITQMPIIPAVKGYQNLGIFFGLEFENMPHLFSFGFTCILRQNLL